MSTAVLGLACGLALGVATAARKEPEIVLIHRPCHPCGTLEVGKRKPEAERLALKLFVSPRMGFVPLYVQARIRVSDPKQVLVCPRFHLLAQVEDEPPDYTSGFPGDVRCNGDGPRVHSPRPRLIPLRRPGAWEIHASMADHGLTLHDRQTVHVIGRGEP